MALEKKVITLPIGSMSMDDSKDPKVNASAMRVENAIHKQVGVIEKRHGSKQVSNTASYNTWCVGALGSAMMRISATAQLLRADQSTLSMVSPVYLADGYHTNLVQTHRTVALSSDIAEIGDHIAVAYNSIASSQYSLHVEVFDRRTGAPKSIVENIVTGAVRPVLARFAIVGATLRAYYFDAGGSLYTMALGANGVFGSASVLVTSAHSASYPEWDIAVVANGGTQYVLVIFTASGGTTATITSLASGTAVQATLDITGYTQVRHPSVWAQTSSVIGIAFADVASGSKLRLHCGFYNWDTTAVLAAKIAAVRSGMTSVSSAGVRRDTADAKVYWTVKDSNLVPRIDTVRAYTAGTMTDGYAYQQRSILAAKPYAMPAATYRHIVPTYLKSWNYANQAQDIIIHTLATTGMGIAVGQMLPGLAKMDDSYGYLPQTHPVGDGYSFLTSASYLTQVDNSANAANLYQLVAAYTTIGVSTSDTTARVAVRRLIDIGPRRLLIPSQLPYECDGTNAVEHGFLLYPEPFSAASTSGGSMEAGTYRYKAVYEWIDGNGVRQQSAPSPEYNSITLTTGTAVVLTLPVLPVTTKTGVQVAVYRTIKDTGTTYYRIGAVANDTSAATVAITDTLPDSFITDMDTLYTDSGELEHIHPKPHRVAAIWQSRHFYADRDAEDTDICYGMEASSRDAVNHNDSLVLRCEAAGGAITALAPFLDKLLIFKASRIYATEGAGYDSTLGGSNFVAPYMVSAMVGCPNNKLWAQTTQGIAFIGSDGGVWLLDHSLRLTSIGDPVYTWLHSSTPKALVVEPAQSLLHVMTDGYDLVFNTDEGKWSLWGNHACDDAVAVDGTLWWVDRTSATTRTVKAHDSSLYADSGTAYPLRIDTGWISFAGTGGVQRVYRFLVMGQHIASHTLRIKVAYDYDPVWTDNNTYASTRVQAFDLSAYYGAGLDSSYAGQAYCVEVFPTRPCCSAIRISIADEGSGNTWSVTSIAFLVGVKTGMARIDGNRVV